MKKINVAERKSKEMRWSNLQGQETLRVRLNREGLEELE